MFPPDLRPLAHLSRTDSSGEAGLALAERLAALGLERGAARQLERALPRIEAQKGPAEAEACLDQWLARWPAHHRSRLALVARLERRAAYEEAHRVLEAGLTLAPQHGPFWQRLGQLFSRVGRYGDAIEVLKRAAQCDPAHVSCRTELGHLHRNVGFVDEAIHWHGEALALQPDSLLLHLNHLFVLPLVASSHEQIDHCRRRCEDGLPALEQHLDQLPATRRVEALRPKAEIVCHPFYLLYHNRDDRQLLERYARLMAALVHGAWPPPPLRAPRLASPLLDQPDAGPDAASTPGGSGVEQRLRLGLISGFFHDHSNARAFEGLIRHLDRDRFEVVLIHLASSPRDGVSERLESWCDRTLILPPRLNQASEALQELALDLLFYTDLGMHPFLTLLASRRLAPVQATGWGVPQTSGMESIDYYVSGDLVEPPQAERQYSETLVRLPGLPCCYLSASLDPVERNRDYYLLPPDRQLWGCLHRFDKFHPDFDAALEAIARAVPESLFVFVEEEVPALTGFLLDRLARTAPTARERMLILARMERRDFLALGGCLDVLLDPFHFGSGITLYETIHSGTPVVTLEGAFLRSRYVAAAYRLMGVNDAPVARTPEEYVALAVGLMADSGRRQRLRQQIAGQARTHLYDRLEYVRGFERFVQKAVAASRAADQAAAQEECAPQR